jgi:hypothetical protein
VELDEVDIHVARKGLDGDRSFKELKVSSVVLGVLDLFSIETRQQGKKGDENTKKRPQDLPGI